MRDRAFYYDDGDGRMVVLPADNEEDDFYEHVCVCEHMDTSHEDGDGPCRRAGCRCVRFRLGELV